MSTKEELISRWDGFLGKIEIRFNESLQHATDACFEQLERTDYDYLTVIKSWMGIKAQIHDLVSKIDQTWHAKVEPEMRAIGDFWIDESHKASELSDQLTLRLFRYEIELEGTLSQKFYDHAIKLGDVNLNCNQCNATINFKKDLFRAQYVTCPYCTSVNTVQPDPKFVQLGWGIVDNIARLNMIDKYDQMEAAANAISEQRFSAADHFWDTYKEAYFNYYESYFKERIRLKPDAQERYDDDMERKRKEYENYENVRRYDKKPNNL